MIYIYIIIYYIIYMCDINWYYMILYDIIWLYMLGWVETYCYHIWRNNHPVAYNENIKSWTWTGHWTLSKMVGFTPSSANGLIVAALGYPARHTALVSEKICSLVWHKSPSPPLKDPKSKSPPKKNKNITAPRITNPQNALKSPSLNSSVIKITFRKKYMPHNNLSENHLP